MKHRYISLFEKSVIVFLIMGITPLFIIGFSLFRNFSIQMEESVVANYSQMNEYVGRSISNIVDEMEAVSRSIYSYRITEYDYFYEIVKDERLTEAERELWVTGVLRNILYSNQYIDHVYWIDRSGRVYSSMRPPEKMANAAAMEEWYEETKGLACKKLIALPTHISSYFCYSSRQDVTFIRQVMDTSTIQGAQGQVLGTLYIDMNMERISNLMEELSGSDKGRFYIVDMERKVFVYHPEYYQMGETAVRFTDQIKERTSNKRYVKTDDGYLLYQPIAGTDWLMLVALQDTEVSTGAKALKQSTIWLLSVAAILIGVMYWSYSKVTSTPMRKLKDAMLKIREGDLDIYIDVHTNDEVGILAVGLNQMTSDLKKHINKVYVAEIRQRDAEIKQQDAELAALKTQIQPHYLYNTLEVIRMMAITNDDLVTAEMLESLSRQMKYLLRTSKGMVSLRDEIDNIRGYFKLIRLRFENAYVLEIDVREEFMSLKVPHLILQPIVENAIKHGLRPKGSEGQIGIVAREKDGILEISVIDNGIGIEAEKLKEIQEKLLIETSAVKFESCHEALLSIGMINVNERIKLKFGSDYGIDITSYQNLGTNVIYKLPLIGGDDDVYDTAG